MQSYIQKYVFVLTLQGTAIAVDEAHCVKTWGDEFRLSLAQIGELRSIVPSTVNIIALTATATVPVLKVVTQRLSMLNPILVAQSPYRENISYKVHEKTDVDTFCTSLCGELCHLQIKFPKTIIYVRTYKDCIDIYMQLKIKMGLFFTEPQSSPNIVGFRLLS